MSPGQGASGSHHNSVQLTIGRPRVTHYLLSCISYSLEYGQLLICFEQFHIRFNIILASCQDLCLVHIVYHPQVLSTIAIQSYFSYSSNKHFFSYTTMISFFHLFLSLLPKPFLCSFFQLPQHKFLPIWSKPPAEMDHTLWIIAFRFQWHISFLCRIWNLLLRLGIPRANYCIGFLLFPICRPFGNPSHSRAVLHSSQSMQLAWVGDITGTLSLHFCHTYICMVQI